MSLIDPSETIPEDIPADPTTQKDLRRTLLLVALISLLVPGGLCWYSTQVETIEQVLIPGLLGLIVLFYTLYYLYQREQRQDLAPPLWRVGLIMIFLLALVSLALVWLISAVGWLLPSGPIILVLGAWSLFLAGRRVWESWSFYHRGIEEKNNLAEIKMISIAGGHPIHPQLVYRYAEKYRGQIENHQIRNKTPELLQAIQEGKLQVKVKYLPDNPKIHRFLGWKILE